MTVSRVPGAAPSLLAAVLLAVVASGALGAGCEVAVDPIDRGARVFSMSGYLDTEADTHWVRIEPLGVSIDPIPRLIDARVVVDGPGGETPFSQKVVTLSTGPAHLFWVVAGLDPGQTYTVVATDADGAATRARVQMPPPMEPPVLEDGPQQCPTLLTVRGPEPVADAFVTYRLGGETPRTVTVSRRRELLWSENQVQATAYFGTDAPDLGLDPFDIFNPNLSAEIATAVVTPAWPESTDLETVLIPTDRDIENGVGFVGGATVWRRSFQPGVYAIPFGETRPCLERGLER